DSAVTGTSRTHGQEWERALIKYAFPLLGSLPVAAIDTPLVLRVLKPIWSTTPESASRVRGRIENVIGWATIHGYRSGDNPARWNGHLEHALPAGGKGDHHAALPYAAGAAFMTKLRAPTSVPAKCLEFLILTSTRLDEAREATWDEIDLDQRLWIIPALAHEGPPRASRAAEHRRARRAPGHARDPAVGLCLPRCRD